jgi:hypothetical protein
MTAALTRVAQTYQRLRNVPQLKQLPSVVIQLIAEYGPPSLWIVCGVKNTQCYALYPAACIEAISARTSGEGRTNNDRKRSPARTRSPSTATTAAAAAASSSSSPLIWSNGWQQLPIMTYPQPTYGVDITQSTSGVVDPTGPQEVTYMKYNQWAYNEWILVPQVYETFPRTKPPKILTLPHDEPVTRVWLYPLPSPAPAYHGIATNTHSIWCYETGTNYFTPDRSFSPSFTSSPTPLVYHYFHSIAL